MEIFSSRYFTINKTLLDNLGLWPYQNPIRKFFLRVFLIVFIFSASVPQLYGLHKNFGIRMDKIIEHLALLLYIYGIKLKLVTSILSEKELKIVYENIAENWTTLKDEHELKILKEYSERGRMLTIGYIAYMISALTFYILLPLAPGLLNIIQPLPNGTRPLDFIFHGEFPVEDMHDYYGEIYIFDALAAIATVVVFCTVDTMYVACTEHCLGLFAIVKHRLELSTKNNKKNICNYGDNFSEQIKNDRDDIAHNMIVRTIKLHKKIIGFTNTLEASYSTSFLILMGLNMLYCSFVSVLLIIKRGEPMERLRYGTILGGLLIHLFYISWPGQKMIDHSSGLFDDAYMNKWYESTIKSQHLLRFMRLRCLTPCQLTAGGIYVMNFENFASIIKTSTSYITVFASFT